MYLTVRMVRGEPHLGILDDDGLWVGPGGMREDCDRRQEMISRETRPIGSQDETVSLSPRLPHRLPAREGD